MGYVPTEPPGRLYLNVDKAELPWQRDVPRWSEASPGLLRSSTFVLTGTKTRTWGRDSDLDESAYCDSILCTCCATLERLRIALPPLKERPFDRPAFFLPAVPKTPLARLANASNLYPAALRSLMTTSGRLSVPELELHTRACAAVPGESGPPSGPLGRFSSDTRLYTFQDPPVEWARSMVRPPKVLERVLPTGSRHPRLRMLSMVCVCVYVRRDGSSGGSSGIAT